MTNGYHRFKKSVINISNTVRSDSISNKKKRKIYASSDSEQIQAEFFTEFSLDLEFDRSFTNIAININIHTEIEMIKARLFHSGNVKTKEETRFLTFSRFSWEQPWWIHAL